MSDHSTTPAGQIPVRDLRPSHVRPVHSDDGPALHALTDRWLGHGTDRFLAPSYVEQALRDGRNGDALVGMVGDDIVALGAFSRLECDPLVASVTLVADDSALSTGLGLRVLRDLAAIARRQGVHGFVADLQPGDPLLLLLADSGFATRTEHPSGGLIEMYVDLAVSGETPHRTHLEQP